MAMPNRTYKCNICNTLHPNSSLAIDCCFNRPMFLLMNPSLGLCMGDIITYGRVYLNYNVTPSQWIYEENKNDLVNKRIYNYYIVERIERIRCGKRYKAVTENNKSIYILNEDLIYVKKLISENLFLKRKAKIITERALLNKDYNSFVD